MRPRYALARKKATDLLKEAKIVAPPVPVERLAKLKGAAVRYEPFEGQMSGLLYKASATDQTVIGINALHPSSRQRFTIAHEIGHLLLHEDTNLQVDQHAFLAFRDLASAIEDDPKEVEANQFAATLLMPEELLRRCVLELEPDLDLETAISRLAQQFGVSEQAMTIRLTSLRWIAGSPQSSS